MPPIASTPNTGGDADCHGPGPVHLPLDYLERSRLDLAERRGEATHDLLRVRADSNDPIK